jgi:transcriptional regulator with XRE-family HTH domain
MSDEKKTFEALFQAAEDRPEYWQQDAILDFAEELCRLMEEKGVSRAELARRIGKSPAYITEVLRAESNFTIGTMTRLGMALGCRLRLHLAPKHSVTYWKDSLYFPEDSALRSDYTVTAAASDEDMKVVQDETSLLVA